MNRGDVRDILTGLGLVVGLITFMTFAGWLAELFCTI